MVKTPSGVTFIPQESRCVNFVLKYFFFFKNSKMKKMQFLTVLLLTAALCGAASQGTKTDKKSVKMICLKKALPIATCDPVPITTAEARSIASPTLPQKMQLLKEANKIALTTAGNATKAEFDQAAKTPDKTALNDDHPTNKAKVGNKSSENITSAVKEKISTATQLIPDGTPSPYV